MYLLEELKSQFKQTNNAVVKLILVNVLVFLALRLTAVTFDLFSHIDFRSMVTPYIRLSDVPMEVLQHPWTLVTTIFTHWDLEHLFWNMLGLFFIGRFFQSEFGDKRLVAVYLLTGLGANIFYLIGQHFILFYTMDISYLVGASGAITGLLIALVTLYPDKEMSIFFLPMFRFKMKWIGIIMITVYVISLTGQNGGGHLCHVGGALMGFIYIKLLQKGNDLTIPVIKVLYFFETLLKKKAPKMNVSHSKYNKGSKSDITDVDYKDISMDDVDKILDKLKVSGYPSLSAEEKRILFEYSKQ